MQWSRVRERARHRAHLPLSRLLTRWEASVRFGPQRVLLRNGARRRRGARHRAPYRSPCMHTRVGGHCTYRYAVRDHAACDSTASRYAASRRGEPPRLPRMATRREALCETRPDAHAPATGEAALQRTVSRAVGGLVHLHTAPLHVNAHA